MLISYLNLLLNDFPINEVIDPYFVVEELCRQVKGNLPQLDCGRRVWRNVYVQRALILAVGQWQMNEAQSVVLSSFIGCEWHSFGFLVGSYTSHFFF